MVIIGVVLVVIAGLGGWQWYLTDRLASETHADFYNALVSENASFAQAQRLHMERRFAEALPYYNEALKEASSDEQRLQIRLLEARTMMQLQEYAKAVPLLKEIIAADPSARTAYGRAAAAADIADIYSRGIFTVNRDIFNDEPFTSLWVANDVALTLRHVYEYSASIYPIALSQLRIAEWYANQLPDARTPSKTLSESDVQAYLATIQQLVASADQDIAYLREDDAMAGDLHAALLERAVVVGNLNRHGNTSLGEADEDYAQAIEAYVTEGPGQDGIARYYYALFMAQADGAVRKSDIQAILAPLSGADYADSPVRQLLQTARTVLFYRQFPSLLASIDPEFKKFLMTLGWTAADFSS